MPGPSKFCALMLAIWFGLSHSISVAQQEATLPEENDSGLQVSQADATSIDFVRDIQPIFREHCYECHSGTTEEGGLNLGIKARVIQNGDKQGVIVAGDSAESLLIELVDGRDKDRIMPPEPKARLDQRQIDLLRAWIDQGTLWPEEADVVNPKFELAKSHWSFQRLRQVDAPSRHDDDNWSQGVIDRFLWQRLNEEGILPASPSDARTLVRRLYFDLIGLPPTPEQTQKFIAAHEVSPVSAVQNLVDELLQSPHYGERWGRYWLDVARYADSDGQEADKDRPHAYIYRDFVIDAFNTDMPYDQFVRWQIAGDEYEPDNDAAVAATGFLTSGPAFKLPDTFLESERLANRYNELDDIISTLGSGLLGITVACARCHDHKYDPLSAKEYYQLLGVFHSGDRVTGKLPSGKEGFIFQDFDSQRRATWLFRRSDFYDREIELDIGFPEFLSSEVAAEDFWQKAKAAYRQHGEVKSTLQRRALADWLTDTEKGAGALLARVIVNRLWHHHFGQGLVRTTSDFGLQGDKPSHPDLLEYLSQELVASGWRIKSLQRAILNSSAWQQTSTKDGLDPRGYEIDPSNSLLWRMTPRRLEAEVIRDAMLAASNTLNLQAGGPGFKPYIAPEANLARNIKGEAYPKDVKDDEATRRRSVYMFHKRLIPYPMFQSFDRPDLMTSCARRQNTTVPTQAMVILNDRFVRSVALDFARMLKGERSSEPQFGDIENQKIVERAFLILFARLPNSLELEASLDFIEVQTQARLDRSQGDSQQPQVDPSMEALADYCQSLFGLNEFIYVD